MKQIFVISGVPSVEAARLKATEWYAHKPNFSVDSVEPSDKGGYKVTISYDEETKTN